MFQFLYIQRMQLRPDIVAATFAKQHTLFFCSFFLFVGVGFPDPLGSGAPKPPWDPKKHPKDTARNLGLGLVLVSHYPLGSGFPKLPRDPKQLSKDLALKPGLRFWIGL